MGYAYHSIVEKIQRNFQNGEAYDAGGGCDHEGSGRGEGVLLLLLDTNGSCQELVSLGYVEICHRIIVIGILCII